MTDRYPILDKGWIELQDVMGDDRAIVNAARTSRLGDSKGDDADKKLLFYLMQHRHTTPFEMVEFKFRVKAPLVVCWQWFRHRTWSYDVQSGRYTELEEFYVPDEWRRQSHDNKQASVGTIDSGGTSFLDTALQNHYRDSMNLYQAALNENVAREQARLFLPGFAIYYTFIAKVDAHNLMRFLKLRMGEHAQWEIRQYANVLFTIFEHALPWTAEAFSAYRTAEVER